MPVSVRLSELSPITQAQLTDSDLFLVTDAEATSSKKLTLADFKSHLFSGNSFASFNDVDLSAGATDGQFLRYDATTQRWKAGDISLSSLGELADVDLITNPPSNGDTLIWDGVKFIPGVIDLTPVNSALGIPAGEDDMGAFTGSHLDENKSIKFLLQTLSNAITTEQQARVNAVDGVQASIDALNIDISPDTLDSIDELAGALQDNPNIISEILSSISTLQSEVDEDETNAQTSFGNVATQQATQDGRLTALEDQVSNLDVGLAPETLDTINELAQALGDNPDAITNLQNTLNKLVPQAPTTLAGLAVNIQVNAGTRRLCVGFDDNTGGTSGLSAGDQVKRNTDNTFSTVKIQDVGPGDSGTLTGFVNSNSQTSTTFSSATNNVSFAGLEVTDNKDASLSTRDSGIQADFYQIYDFRFVNKSASDGLNAVYFTHSGEETQKAYFYEDGSDPGAPTLIASSVYLPTSPTYNYSSGIPHYSNHSDNEFSYSLIGRNLSGDMYIQNQLATSSQTTGFTHEGNKNYTDFGDGTNPPVANFGVGINKIASVVQYPRDVHTQVTNNQFSNWTITTPYGSVSDRPDTSATFNIMGSTPRTNVIDEDNILISNVGSGTGNATRVGDGDGDNPVANPQTWSPLGVPSNHEAIVVGGVLKHDVTDYSTGYRPVGPDLSFRTVNAQYAEFDIRRSGVSQFTINYTGSCDGCWVTMPNNTAWQNSLSGTNGWADMFQAYRGSGVPTSAEPGCSSGGVMDNNGGSFTCVFGTESSSNDTENRILVRWKLADDQSITSMSFTA